MPSPKPKFMTLGKSKFVHVVRTAAWDRKHSSCQQVRKYMVAEKIDYRAKGISPEAALALDGCESCATAVVAQELIPADDKRAARKDARDEVLARAKGSKPKKTAKPKAAPKDKPAKAATKPKATKSGTRSTGSDTNAKAKALNDFINEQKGWKSSIDTDKDSGHVVVRAMSGDMVIEAFFIDGKYDVARHATLTVGSWSGTLRGAHAVRRQVDQSLEPRDRPHPEPGRGRSAPRKGKAADEVVPEDESPEDARKRVPFLVDDDDLTIIDAIKGRTIKWRNGTSNSVEQAWLPSEAHGKKRDKITITEHPKTGRRIVNFLVVDSVGEHGEVYAAERSVYLDKIVRVSEGGPVREAG